MKVYLAGPINSRTDDECMGWRKRAKSLLACQVIDPMDRDYRGRELDPGVASVIVEQDKHDVASSDIVLVFFDAPSVGTAMEVFFAWLLHKRVIVINSSKKPLSPWMVYHSTDQVTSLETATQIINEAGQETYKATREWIRKIDAERDIMKPSTWRGTDAYLAIAPELAAGYRRFWGPRRSWETRTSSSVSRQRG